jgi:hypothetical protein
MTYHGDWFRDVKNLEKSGYVETRDDTTHPIAHIGNVPLAMQDGKIKCLSNVLHVPNITNNLVSVGQMIEQGLQVWFNPNGCYVEDFKDKCCLVAKGTLDVGMPEVEVVMFAQGARVVADMDIWHKRIGHVNEQRLKSMQNSKIVIGLPKFKVDGIHRICEACQFGKQTNNVFSHDKNVSKKTLDVVHLDVWGPTKMTSMGGCRYYVSFIDDHTRKVWVYFMKEKSEVFTHF